MILNCTQKTKERFHIKYNGEFEDKIADEITKRIVDKEKNDDFLNWGLKYFSFDKRKCIQVIHFKTKLNIYLFDIKVSDLENIGNIIANYLLEIYHDDELMIQLLHKYFSKNQICVFTKLTNKSAISSLNSNETYFMANGYRFYDYIENNILNTIEINKDANWNHFVIIDKKYILPGEVFKKELIERYK